MTSSSPLINFAHISDIHLPPPIIPWYSFFNKRFFSKILWETKRRHTHKADILHKLLQDIFNYKNLNAILVTGDQTNFGTKEEYLNVCQWLTHIPFPCHVIPGNHDFMTHISAKNSVDLWHKWSGPHFPYIKIYGKIVVIGINSAIPALPFMAYGYVSQKQRKILAALLEYYGKENYCRVLMIHHPPKNHLVSQTKSLLNIQQFSSLLRKYGAEIVLHGHSHHATSTMVENTDIPLLGISSASANNKGFDKISSWNHLSFLEEKKYWQIQNIRRSYQGDILEQSTWKRPKHYQDFI